MTIQLNPLRIGASTMEHQNRVFAGNSHKNKTSGPKNLCSGLSPGDNRSELAKKPALNIRELLGLLSVCALDDARNIVQKNRQEIIEWLKNGSFDAHDGADRLARHAKLKCYNVPKQAKFLLELFKEAGLREQIDYVSKSRYQNIAELAERYL